MDYALNKLMEPICSATRRTLATASLWPDLQEIGNSGVAWFSGRIYLRCYAAKRKETADRMDQWTAERWLNDIHIESPRPPSDPAWRAEVLTQALLLTAEIVPAGTALTPWPVQAVIALQSAPRTVDPDIDYPTGSVHLYQVAQPEDDARTAIEKFAQPVFIVTSDQTGRAAIMVCCRPAWISMAR